MPGDVGERVVDQVVGSLPDVGATAQQVECHRHQVVDPLAARVGSVAAVVLDVEADTGHGQSKRGRQEQGLPPGGCPGDQQHVGDDHPEGNGRGLDVHLRTVPSPPARAAEELVNALTKHDQERVAPGKLHLDVVGDVLGGFGEMVAGRQYRNGPALGVFKQPRRCRLAVVSHRGSSGDSGRPLAPVPRVTENPATGSTSRTNSIGFRQLEQRHGISWLADHVRKRVLIVTTAEPPFKRWGMRMTPTDPESNPIR